MTEREEFEAWLAREWPGLVIDHASLMGFYKGDDGPRIEDIWSGWQAARRTATDRDAIIEQCARVCDARYMGDNNREDMEARRCAQAIRALKITANGEKG